MGMGRLVVIFVRSGILFALLSVLCCQAITQKELTTVVRDILSRLPATVIPDINYSDLLVYVNATNLTATDFTLSDVALEIQGGGLFSSSSLLLTLSGVTGVLDFHLNAGLHGLIPIKVNDQVEGTFADTTIAITFSVSNGDLAMSHIAVTIDAFRLDFGDDTKAQKLADTLEPIIKLQLQTLIPGTIVKNYAHVFDTDTLVQAFFKLLPSATLPEVVFKEGGLDFKITNVKFDSAAALSQAFSIKKQQLIVDVSNFKADGSCLYSVGKVGAEANSGTAVIKVINAKLQVVVEIGHVNPKDKKSGLEISFVSAFQTIEEFALRTNSPDPTVQWFINAIQPTVESMLEDSFVFLMNFLFSL